MDESGLAGVALRTLAKSGYCTVKREVLETLLAMLERRRPSAENPWQRLTKAEIAEQVALNEVRAALMLNTLTGGDE